MATSEPCPTAARRQAGWHGEGLGAGDVTEQWLLLPALLDLKVRQHFGHLCVRLKVLDAEDGEAVVDVAGQAAAGGERSCHWPGGDGGLLVPGQAGELGHALTKSCSSGVFPADAKSSDCYKGSLPAAFLSKVSLVRAFSGDG